MSVSFGTFGHVSKHHLPSISGSSLKVSRIQDHIWQFGTTLKSKAVIIYFFLRLGKFMFLQRILSNSFSSFSYSKWKTFKHSLKFESVYTFHCSIPLCDMKFPRLLELIVFVGHSDVGRHHCCGPSVLFVVHIMPSHTCVVCFWQMCICWFDSHVCVTCCVCTNRI